MDEVRPSVGRIVHYYEQNVGPFAAVITNVTGGPKNAVDLHVFPCRRKIGDFVPIETVQNGVPDEGTRKWCWPPRETT